MKKEYPFYKAYVQGKRVNLTAKKEKKLTSKDRKLISDFCFDCSINSKSKKRAGNIKRSMIQFSDFIEKPLDELQDKDFIYFAEAINRSSRKINGKNDVKIVVKRFGNWLQENKKKSYPSLKKIKIEKQQGSNKIKNTTDLLTELEIDKLIKSTTNLMHKTLICLLWESAGRPEEILKLRWNDIDFEKGNVKLHSSKTKSFRFVPLNLSINHLKRLKEETNKEDDSLLFTSQKQGNQLSNTAFNFIIKNLGKKAGIKKYLSGYTFRHTRLTSLIKTLSPKSYEMISGHSLEMGMRTYAHLSVDDLTTEMREKIFGVEVLTPEQKNKYDKQIEALKTQLEIHNKILENLQTSNLDDDIPINKRIIKIKSLN